MNTFMLPLPQGFDTSGYAEGETFDVPVTVTVTKDGLRVDAVEGMPLAAEAAPVEEVETDLDAEGLETAMGRVPEEMA